MPKDCNTIFVATVSLRLFTIREARGQNKVLQSCVTLPRFTSQFRDLHKVPFINMYFVSPLVIANINLHAEIGTINIMPSNSKLSSDCVLNSRKLNSENKFKYWEYGYLQERRPVEFVTVKQLEPRSRKLVIQMELLAPGTSCTITACKYLL